MKVWGFGVSRGAGGESNLLPPTLQGATCPNVIKWSGDMSQ